MGLCLEGHRNLVGKICARHFTPLTLDVQTGVISDEDTNELWEAARKEAIEKVRGNKNSSVRADSPVVDEEEWKSPAGSADQTAAW
jgi:hypothetical protein